MIKYNLTIILLIIIMVSSACAEATDAFSPWDFTSKEKRGMISVKELSLPATMLKGGVTLFSKYISPVDGDRCPMYPTCAAYSRETIEKHGFFIGIFMTADRLIHEGNEMDNAPLIKVYERLRFLDPVSNNDFWWQ
ncbi:MAG: membrane protein insertion efficiency factor YidD [Syntrophales bacterium LBB04]|nr:membrane protein insertion efficiency factor YidD [Syntrophales bacterium LBB04]